MKTQYRNVAFLVELLINILVFSVSCAVLVGLFGKAQEISHTTKQQTRAHTAVQTLLNTAKARGVEGIVCAEDGEDAWLCSYDENWNDTAAENAVYTIRLVLQQEETSAGVLRHYQAVAQQADGTELASMETAVYYPAETVPVA